MKLYLVMGCLQILTTRQIGVASGAALKVVKTQMPLSASSFSGQACYQRRSFARQSGIQMMPEGPEVRTVVDQLQGGVGRRLVDIQFLSGRYVRLGRPVGFDAFSQSMTPWFEPHSSIDGSGADTIQQWNAKGKFIYILLDDGSNPPVSDNDEDDYQRSIWITLGMTGQFRSESAHEADPRFARWFLELVDIDLGSTRKIYYHDQRNFGTMKFCLSRTELEKKLASLGPDILDAATTEEDFISVYERQRQEMNICKFLMDQSKMSGIGNYILSECLYRANVDPFATLMELNDDMRCRVFQEAQAVAAESYKSQGLTRRGGTFRNVQGDSGQFEFQLQCYGRETCTRGDTVIRETDGPHKRAIWYTEQQLLKPFKERNLVESDPPAKKKQAGVTERKEAQEDDKTSEVEPSLPIGDMLSCLEDKGWKEALSGILKSGTFDELQAFLQEESLAGETIFPPTQDILSAFNLCPFDDVKVVIVGQDPYHGQGQGHGLAFSVRKDIRPPPSLKNIFKEARTDVSIDEPTHGNLDHWAKQGVLLLNTVLTVRRGEANSHKGRGWEDVTDKAIQALNDEKEGLVFLLWGSPAAKKAKNVDETKHVVIKTSHPSPLGATKTASPFLGSRCFSRANQSLQDMGKPPIDWSVL